MARVTVNPGVCGLTTTIIAEADDMYQVAFQIESQCPNIRALAKALPTLEAFAELRQPMNETMPYVLAGQHLPHVACPVPCAILKALEIATGMALPADVRLTISKE